MILLLFLLLQDGGWTYCASEGMRCEFTGTKEVRYGANDSFVFRTVTDGVECSNEVFGDPLVGFGKDCHIRDPQAVEEPTLPPWFTAKLVPGTAMTWTDGVNVWAGNPFCADAGVLIQASSPAVDAGVLIPGHHCPKPGSALNQPRMDDAFNSYCREWYGAGVDTGACEFVPGLIPVAPQSLEVT